MVEVSSGGKALDDAVVAAIRASPNWMSSEGFDIEARAQGPVTSSNEMLLLLQSLLADRFNLRLHRETKESSVYALVIGRDGLKMKLSEDQTAWTGDYPNGAPDGRRLTGASPREVGPD